MTETKETRNYNIYRTSDNMTDAEWQKFFTQMKADIKPIGERYMTKPRTTPIKEGDEYHGETTAVRYKQFINDILRTIRQGEIDYCFYIYQIRDLLKFEPQLKAQWLPMSDCFEVSI